MFMLSLELCLAVLGWGMDGAKWGEGQALVPVQAQAPAGKQKEVAHRCAGRAGQPCRPWGRLLVLSCEVDVTQPGLVHEGPWDPKRVFLQHTSALAGFQ